MCCGMGCPYETYDERCKYHGPGCYAERRERLYRERDRVQRELWVLEEALGDIESALDDPDVPADQKPALKIELEDMEKQYRCVEDALDDLMHTSPEEYND